MGFMVAVVDAATGDTLVVGVLTGEATGATIGEAAGVVLGILAGATTGDADESEQVVGGMADKSQMPLVMNSLNPLTLA